MLKIISLFDAYKCVLFRHLSKQRTIYQLHEEVKFTVSFCFSASLFGEDVLQQRRQTKTRRHGNERASQAKFTEKKNKN